MSRVSSMKWACLALAAVFALFASLAVATSTAYAYDYKVRVWAGNQGAVNGSSTYSEKVYKNGAEIKLSDEFSTTATNDKYYVKGFRPGGADNQERVSEGDNHSNGRSNLRDAIVVTEDMDFVVSYGVKGQMVSYTLHFVERGTGRVLANPITRYGAVGDKPVAAYEYVQGYRPLYRNITGTLKASGNDWTFEYVREAAQTTTSTTTTGGGTTTTTTTTQGGGATASTTTTGGTQGGTQGGATGDNQGAQTTTTSTTQGAGADQNPPATEEILDQDVPLAQQPTSSSSSSDSSSSSSSTTTQPTDQGGLPVAAIIGIAVALAAAIGLVFLLMKRRQDENLQ